MYRPFLFFIIFFISGIIVGSFAKFLGAFIIIIWALSLFGIIFIQNKKSRLALFAVLILFFGAFYYNFRYSRIPGTIVDLANKQQTLVGIISDAPIIKDDKITYDVRALYVLKGKDHEHIRGKVRLSTPSDGKGSIYRYGDVIKFSGKLKLPQSRRNPNGFDYRSYLLQKGISTTMFSREITGIGRQRLNPFKSGAFYLRERLTDFYEAQLPKGLSSLMIGIVLGIKDNIPVETMRAVRKSGVAHVLAVSGLHTGIIYGALELVFYRFQVSRMYSFVIGTAAILFYSLMAGMSPSVIRAAIMIIVFMLSKVVGRENDPLNNLCLSAAILLALNPLTLFSVSFQLSYAAVLGIILFYTTLKKFFERLPKYIGSSIAVVLSAQLAVSPILAYYFHNISVIGLFTNLLVVPLVSIALISGLISGFVGLFSTSIGTVLIKVPGILLKIIEKIVLINSKMPFATVIIPALSPFSIILYFTFLALIFDLLPHFSKIVTKYRRVLAVILLFLAFLNVKLSTRGFEVTFLDVGQGDSIFVKTKRNKVVLIDGGGMPVYYSGDFDIGNDVIIPFLYSKGISKIDVMVFTHFDADHAGGLLSILKSMKVKNIIYGIAEDCTLYKEMLQIAQQKQIKTTQVCKGDQFTIDGVTFDVLNPITNTHQYCSSNDGSVVLKMNYKGVDFLFTGDLEHNGEQSLVNTELDIRANILKVGHHGSNTSTSSAFLSNVTPSYGIISVGEDNTFGHPSRQVIDLLEENGVTIFRTDFDGGISVKISDRNLKIYTTIPGEI